LTQEAIGLITAAVTASTSAQCSTVVEAEMSADSAELLASII
jgi:hypothetical protein